MGLGGSGLGGVVLGGVVGRGEGEVDQVGQFGIRIVCGVGKGRCSVGVVRAG